MALNFNIIFMKIKHIYITHITHLDYLQYSQWFSEAHYCNTVIFIYLQ